MSRKLSKEKAEIEALKAQLLRLQADFENFRKRTENEKTEIQKKATALMLLDLVPVLDNFERALKHIPKELENSHCLQGIKYIYKDLQKILTQEGLEKIPTLGTQFDPYLHEALSYEKSSKHKTGEIIEEIESGYKFGEQILKVAKVKVAK